MRQQFRINCQNKLQQAQTPQTKAASKEGYKELQREKRMAEAAKELDSALRGIVASNSGIITDIIHG